MNDNETGTPISLHFIAQPDSQEIGSRNGAKVQNRK